MTTSPTADLLDACTQLNATDVSLSEAPSPQLRATTRAFVLDVARRGELEAEVLESLHSLPPHGAAWLALAVGSAVEQGLAPSVAGPSLVQVFRDWLEKTKDGQDADRLAALPTLAQAVVTHLARLQDLRTELASDAAWVRTLDDRAPESPGISWVYELIARRSGDLFVVHATAQRVCHLRFWNVARCYHLFSLIQSVLGSALPGGELPNDEVAAAARGRSEEPVTDRASWHFQRAGAKPSTAKAVWGDESVDVLKGPDGAYAISLWEPIMGVREWSSSAFGPALEAAPSDMRFMAELKNAEAAAWVDRVLT
ncbi:MAG: hypothetical protein AAGG01_11195 [Planctomycetota bacterium]